MWPTCFKLIMILYLAYVFWLFLSHFDVVHRLTGDSRSLHAHVLVISL